MPPFKLWTIIRKILPTTMTSLLVRFRRWLQPADRPTALQEEIQFWRDWFVTGGLQWRQDFDERFDPNQPIQKHLASYIDRLETDRVHILDVGSGPLTKLGKIHPSKQIMITATDLLAQEYDRLLEDLEMEPPIRTIYADAENLAEQFGRDTYDIVHGQNCIDHTADPLRSIKQMLAVSKPQGFVVLFHAENEGKREQYHQLHQWDFTCEDGFFVIRDRRGRATNVTKELAAVGEVECTRVQDGDDFAILTGIRKYDHPVGDS